MRDLSLSNPRDARIPGEVKSGVGELTRESER